MRVTSIALLLWLAPQTPVPAPEPTIAAAQALNAAGNAVGAKAMLERIVASTPTNGFAWTFLGNVCLGNQLKDFDCAIAAFTKVLALQPSSPQALLSLGIAHAGKGETDTAFRFLGEARATRRIDMTQLSTNPLVEPLRKDARYAPLMPVPSDFANPFVEPTLIVHDWHGEGAGDGFGWIARSIGDVDGDRVQDFVTSSPTYSTGGANRGRVYVYSSKTGKLLWKADGESGERLGVGIEAAGDVNRDGAGDVIASAPGGGLARVFDGKTGAVLLTLKAGEATARFGGHAAGVGDVNGDKYPDLIVGAAGGPSSPPDFSGRAYIFSGKDGSLLFTFKGEAAGDGFGSAVSGATVGGKTTIVVGAGTGGRNKTGRGYVYGGLIDSPSFVIDGDDTSRALAAMFVGVPGDLDGDRVQDVYVSDWSNAAKGPSTGRVYLYSGKTGKLLYALTGETPGEAFGTTQATAGDVDGDGTPDLIVGSWQYGAAAIGGGRAYLYSGRSGQLLKTFTSRVPGETFGFDAVGIGDVDGNGTVDLLITAGASAVNGFRSGRVFIISSGLSAKHGGPGL